MSNGRQGGEQYGDAIPAAWSCEQTYLRNHHALSSALAFLVRDVSVDQPIRILQIGAGVIELMLVQALCESMGLGARVRVDSIDPSPRVADILQAVQAGRPFRGPDSEPIYDPKSRSLSLRGLAHAFPSPEGTVNVHLSDPQKIRRAASELSALGLLSSWGLPPDADGAASILLTTGLPVPPPWVARINHRCAAFPDIELTARTYHLIVAMFSLQYPVMAGRAAEVARAVERGIATGGLFLHGATYGAQVRLLRALVDHRPDLVGSCGVREIDRVRYEGDSASEKTRLRIRCDALVARFGEGHDELSEGIFPQLPWPDQLASSFRDVCARLGPDDGLEGPLLAAAFCAGPSSGRITWADRADLLCRANPLPCRVAPLRH